MKLILSCGLIVLSSSLFAQSKKELLDQVSKLKTETAQLKNEIELLKKAKEITLSTEQKKASYGVGILIASNLKAQGGDSLDLNTINAGIGDIYLNNPLKIGKQEASGFVQSYLQKCMALKTVKMKEEGTTFLAANKTKEGVITTSTGLQYKVISAGKGKMPTANDQVTVHYTGKTLDGNIFDTSLREGKPITFGVSGVIAGWTEALQLMHEGDKWILYIPSELAYGERGNGAAIPPYATLIFELELLKVN
jgi:FKBP-type peptidyl-prolyl cis-trans isomerase